MLRTRIITALILAPIALAGVILLPPHVFAVVFWAAAGLGLYEWSQLLRWPRWGQFAYLLLYGVIAFAVYLAPERYNGVLWLGCVCWLFAIVTVLSFPRAQHLMSLPVILAPVGLAIVVPAWLALVVIRAQPDGAYWLIWLMFLVWGADIGGYFAGRVFGRRKLAVNVSPGKTWEGAFGGFVLAGAICSFGLMLLDAQMLMGMAILAGLIVISVFGDLFESVVKRSTGVKDSGSLLPGHGGVLDRIDSLLAVLPIFASLLAAGLL